MNRKPVLIIVAAALAILPMVATQADAEGEASSSWLRDEAAEATAAVADPVFVAGIDSGGAGEQIQPGPGCRLIDLCVNDSYCHQVYPGFWACVWIEGAACNSIFCESGE